MQKTPKSLRLQIGIFGRRNAGKSSVLNALTGQDVAIVSEVAGTTTDPVMKPMEMLPLGPVLFIDTAGFDDSGDVGELRMDKTRKMLQRIDIALLIVEPGMWGEYEEEWKKQFESLGVPMLVIVNKSDLGGTGGAVEKLAGMKINAVPMSALTKDNVFEAKGAIIRAVPDSWYKQAGILDGIVNEGDTVVMVIPIDKEAPKGRIILPQVQTLRDILNKKADAVVTDEKRLPKAVENLKNRPRLVITDSQVFKEVAENTPEDIPLTSFSIAFARYKGDLDELEKGAHAIDELTENDRVLVAEACTHHPIGDDIGRVKIPNWLRAKAGEGLQIGTISGHDYPDDLEKYSLVIHCGACMFNRKEMLNRILKCQKAGVPVTNYGVTIAHLHGILERSLAPFM